MYSIDKFVNQYAIMKYVSISMAENGYNRERIVEYLDSNCDCNKFLTETINILNELNKESRWSKVYGMRSMPQKS